VIIVGAGGHGLGAACVFAHTVASDEPHPINARSRLSASPPAA